MSAGPKLILGLTGGIGSGKSTVANLFVDLGVVVVDTDAIAHELTSPGGAAMPAIIKVFGVACVDSLGGLDRRSMRELVFSDGSAKQRLEAILHPLIREIGLQRLAQATSPYGILMVPLLIESKDYRARVDRVLVVDCDEQTQLARTMARSGFTEDVVRAIMASQVTRDERLAAADDVIDNNGDVASLVPQVNSLHQRYLALAHAISGNPIE